MPWKETCAMDERIQFVAEHLRQESSLSELSRLYGISRPTAYKWLERYALYGPAGLLERSRAPKQHPNQTACRDRRRIIALRQRHPQWGPRKLLVRLQKRRPPRALACAEHGGGDPEASRLDAGAPRSPADAGL